MDEPSLSSSISLNSAEEEEEENPYSNPSFLERILLHCSKHAKYWETSQRVGENAAHAGWKSSRKLQESSPVATLRSWLIGCSVASNNSSFRRTALCYSVMRLRYIQVRGSPRGGLALGPVNILAVVKMISLEIILNCHSLLESHLKFPFHTYWLLLPACRVPYAPPCKSKKSTA